MNYLVYGNSYKLIDNEIEKIVKEYPKTVYFIGESSLGEIIEDVSYNSLFDERKVIVVRYIEKLFKSKSEDNSELESLLNYLNNPNENVILIFVSYEKINSRSKLNKEILGTWKIKEILPNINFNYKKQKSNPKTEYNKIEFKDDGTTNHKDLKWSNDNLFLITKDHVVANKMIIKNIDNKKYLEIRMSELSKVYYHAKPISYIYEREEK